MAPRTSAFRRTRREDGRAVCDFRLLEHDFVDALQGSRAALKDVDHPSQCDDRPRELDHVGEEGGKVADRDAVQEHFAAPKPEHENDGQTEGQFQRRPKQSHQARQGSAVDVVGIFGFEGGSRRLPAHRHE